MDKCSSACDFAFRAYGSEGELAHPLEVRELVRCAGAGDDLQAAAILHDLVEDTDVEVAAIAARFGPQAAAYVAAMTEDESIEDYAARKEEHRLRARDAGREVALLFVADKLSNARRMRRGDKELDARKLGHYRATLDTMTEAYADLPLLGELRAELAALATPTARA